ncbi:MAG: hypothetical protein JW917_10735 [Ignavibacteria bacterium]|nr:hypothetical protein [Ignavibacteria bacterium]
MTKSKNAGYYILWTLGILFLGGILYSVVSETLLPLWNEGSKDEFMHNIIGIPVILTGTIIFVYGGYRFVKDSFSTMGNEKLITNTSKIRTKETPKEIKSTAKKENFQMQLNAWKTGGKYLLLGALLIIAGGITINLKQII